MGLGFSRHLPGGPVSSSRRLPRAMLLLSVQFQSRCCAPLSRWVLGSGLAHGPGLTALQGQTPTRPAQRCLLGSAWHSGTWNSLSLSSNVPRFPRVPFTGPWPDVQAFTSLPRQALPTAAAVSTATASGGQIGGGQWGLPPLLGPQPCA